MNMAKCTGKRCPMQVGYKVDECDYKDCLYRTEPITNAQKIRAMSDEELAEFIYRCEMSEIDYAKTFCDLSTVNISADNAALTGSNSQQNKKF